MSLLADDPKFRRQTGVDETEILVMEAFEQAICQLIRENEFDFHGQLACEFEEVRGVQDAVTPEPFDRLEDGSAVNSHAPGVLQQPFVEQLVFMSYVFVNVEAQVRTVHVLVPSPWFFVQVIRRGVPG
jgi:hypothetical protein